MRSLKKNKTVKSGTISICQPPKRKHLSTTNSIGLDKAKFIALDFIQSLLTRVQEEGKFNERYIRKVNIILTNFFETDDKYFQTEEAIHHEPSCHAEQEPQSDQPMIISTLNKQLNHKRTARKTTNCSEFKESLKSIKKGNVMEHDKRDKQMVIQKLKKDYLAILNSQYLSESKPLGETRKYFQDTDEPEITVLRNHLSKNHAFLTSKLSKSSLIVESKKYKNLISNFNPASSMNTSQIQNVINQSDSYNSLGSRNRNIGSLDESILIKQTNLNQIVNIWKPLKSINEKSIVTEELQKVHSIGEQNMKGGNARDRLRLQVNQSLSSLSKVKIKQVSSRQGKNRDKNCQSVSFLPKIGRT